MIRGFASRCLNQLYPWFPKCWREPPYLATQTKLKHSFLILPANNQLYFLRPPVVEHPGVVTNNFQGWWYYIDSKAPYVHSPRLLATKPLPSQTLVRLQKTGSVFLRSPRSLNWTKQLKQNKWKQKWRHGKSLVDTKRHQNDVRKRVLPPQPPATVIRAYIQPFAGRSGLGVPRTRPMSVLRDTKWGVSIFTSHLAAVLSFIEPVAEKTKANGIPSYLQPNWAAKDTRCWICV